MDRRMQCLVALLAGLFGVPGCAGPRGEPFGDQRPTFRDYVASIRREKRSPAPVTNPPALTPNPTDKSDAPMSDVELRMTVDRELADATPQERAEVKAVLVGKSRKNVHTLLQIRRINLSHRAETGVAQAAPVNTTVVQAARPVSEPGHSAPQQVVMQTSATPDRSNGVSQAPFTSTATPPSARLRTQTSGPTMPARDLIPNQYPAPEATVPKPEAPAAPVVQAQAMLPKKTQPSPAATAPAPARPEGLVAMVTGLAQPRAALPRLEEPATTAPIPSEWNQSEAFRSLVDVAARDVAQRKPGSGDPREYTQKHAYLRMLYLMGNQSERAVEAIPGVDAADQMFWQQTLWGIHNYFDSQNIPGAEDRATQTVQQLTAAAQHLQEKANLQLRNVTFCQQILSFGTYERFPQYEFNPGQQVLLYAEVNNFHSEETDNGQQFRTILKSTVELYRAGAGGEPEKIQLPVPATEDLCRNRRRDYFHTYEFLIPSRLAPGPHVLKLTVEDTLTNKVATATVNFTVK